MVSLGESVEDACLTVSFLSVWELPGESEHFLLLQALSFKGQLLMWQSFLPSSTAWSWPGGFSSVVQY